MAMHSQAPQCSAVVRRRGAAQPARRPPYLCRVEERHAARQGLHVNGPAALRPPSTMPTDGVREEEGGRERGRGMQ